MPYNPTSKSDPVFSAYKHLLPENEYLYSDFYDAFVGHNSWVSNGDAESDISYQLPETVLGTDAYPLYFYGTEGIDYIKFRGWRIALREAFIDLSGSSILTARFNIGGFDYGFVEPYGTIGPFVHDVRLRSDTIYPWLSIVLKEEPTGASATSVPVSLPSYVKTEWSEASETFTFKLSTDEDDFSAPFYTFTADYSVIPDLFSFYNASEAAHTIITCSDGTKFSLSDRRASIPLDEKPLSSNLEVLSGHVKAYSAESTPKDGTWIHRGDHYITAPSITGDYTTLNGFTSKFSEGDRFRLLDAGSMVLLYGPYYNDGPAYAAPLDWSVLTADSSGNLSGTITMSLLSEWDGSNYTGDGWPASISATVHSDVPTEYQLPVIKEVGKPGWGYDSYGGDGTPYVYKLQMLTPPVSPYIKDPNYYGVVSKYHFSGIRQNTDIEIGIAYAYQKNIVGFITEKNNGGYIPTEAGPVPPLRYNYEVMPLYAYLDWEGNKLRLMIGTIRQSPFDFLVFIGEHDLGATDDDNNIADLLDAALPITFQNQINDPAVYWDVDGDHGSGGSFMLSEYVFS